MHDPTDGERFGGAAGHLQPAGYAPGTVLRASDDRTYVVDGTGAWRRCVVVDNQVVGVRKDKTLSPRQRKKLRRAARRQQGSA
jgi:hypothetical protein